MGSDPELTSKLKKSGGQFPWFEIRQGSARIQIKQIPLYSQFLMTVENQYQTNYFYNLQQKQTARLTNQISSKYQ